jgi:hypothetical protein
LIFLMSGSKVYSFFFTSFSPESRSILFFSPAARWVVRAHRSALESTC